MNRKNPAYYTSIRNDLVAFVPEAASRILEVGCGTGLTGKALKEDARHSREVVGIEKKPEIAEQAKANIDSVIVGDVERVTLPQKDAYFDCIIYGEVLEHLLDPWGLLLRHRELLKEGGRVIASIPNIAHYRVVRMLRRKEWNYQDEGVLDRSHVRFFALKNIQSMFAQARLDIIKIDYKISASGNRKILNKLLCGALLHDIVEQYVIVAEKPAA